MKDVVPESLWTVSMKCGVCRACYKDVERSRAEKKTYCIYGGPFRFVEYVQENIKE